jgi:hypothetical protein
VQQVRGSEAGRAQTLAAASGGLQIVVVLLAACLPLRPTISGFPLSTMAAALLVVLAAFHRPTVTGRVPRVAALAFVGLVLWMVGASTVFHGIEVRRAGNLLVLLALVWVLGQGRIHSPSFVAGLALGWAGGIAHAVLTRDESTYDGRITGYLGDPNGAGFVIVTLGCVLIAYARSSGRRTWPLWLFTGAAVALTFSRTSLFAFLAATLWALAAPRLGRWSSLAALVVAWPVYWWLVDAVRETGFFAERAGSDHLRDRLIVVEGLMVDEAGWRGLGLGSAHAVVNDASLWFHNSFRALWVEGGAVAFGLLVVGLVALFWSIHQVPRERRNAWYEAAILAALICSINIGFSLTSVTMAVAVGMYVLYWRTSVPGPPEAPDVTRGSRGAQVAARPSRAGSR